MYKVKSYSKSTDDNAYYIELLYLDNPIIVKTRSYKVKPMHQKAYIKREVTIIGECNHSELYNYLVEQYPLFIYFVPEEYLHDNMIDNAITKEGDVLSMIDKSLRTKDRCYKAVMENGLCYRFIPKELRDFNLAYTAISSNGMALKHIEEDYKIYELCLRAVFNDLRAIKYVKEEYIEQLLLDLFYLGKIDEIKVNNLKEELKLVKKNK